MTDDELELLRKTVEAVAALELEVQRLDADRMALQMLCGYLLIGSTEVLKAVSIAAAQTEEMTLPLSISEAQRMRIAEVLGQVLGQIQRWADHREASGKGKPGTDIPPPA